MAQWTDQYLNKVIDPQNLKKKVDGLKKTGSTIATLNGSFDLMHAGHLHMLYQASQVADILIVALNSDESIRGYKGPNRPIIPLKERMQMMAAIEFIDYVTWFNEADPKNILSVIKPDVHVNGSEYGQNCLESAIVQENGGRVQIVDLKPGLSTSEIIKKIVETHKLEPV